MSDFSTRRRMFSLSVLYLFNLQTIRWNIDWGWGGFVFWFTTPVSVTLVVSSRFTIPNIVLWLLTCPKIWMNFPVPLLALLWFLCFWIQELEIEWGNIFNFVQPTRITDVHKLVIFFFNILLHFHDQIIRNEMTLKNACWI